MSRLWPLQSTICRSPAFLSFVLTFRKWRASDKRAAPFPAGAQSLDKCGFQAARFQFEHSRPAGPADLPEYPARRPPSRSEEHTSELQSLMRIAYAVFCLHKKQTNPDAYYIR